MQSLTATLNTVLANSISALSPVGLAPARAFISNGDLAIVDDCCSGILWVRTESIVDDPILGANGTPAKNCMSRWRARIELGYMNCVSSIDSQGRPPSAETMTSEALKDVQESGLLRTVVSALPDLVLSDPIEWEPLTTDGGCAGGAWHFSVRIC